MLIWRALTKLPFPFVGYESQVYNEVYLELGKPLILDAQLNDVSQLTEVKVTGSKNKVFGNGRTGAKLLLEERINFVANISRSADTRLEPSASGGSLVVVMINTTVTL
jgi:hypothetical protein